MESFSCETLGPESLALGRYSVELGSGQKESGIVMRKGEHAEGAGEGETEVKNLQYMENLPLTFSQTLDM